MSSRTHHPSCPARTAPAPLSRVDELWTDARCICPANRRRRRPLTAVVEALCFAAMLGFVAGLPVYLLWRYAA